MAQINNYILVCGGTGCRASHSAEIIDALKNALEAAGLAEQVQVIRTGCFGFCEQGPIVKIVPDNTFYVSVKPEDSEEIVREHILKGRKVERLLFVAPDTGKHVSDSKHMEFYKPQIRIALRNCGFIDPENIDEYIARDLGIREAKYTGEVTKPLMDMSLSIERNMDKCIMCRRCETACNQMQTVGALAVTHRGFASVLGTAFNEPLQTTQCVNCGQCVAVCPTGALSENNNIREVFRAIGDPKKTVVVQTAPAVRVGLGQDFGFSGRSVTGKMVTALRQLGFDYVFDTDFAADLTIMEEGTELLQRLGAYLSGDKEVKLPLMTSCCPGWVSFMEKHYPELRDNLSTAKSPQQMFGAVAKNYFAAKMGIDRRNLVVVSVMPCVAKKSEAARPEFGCDGDQDVNLSITTRELARMIRFANMNFKELEESDFDRPLGESTGAGVIFGATGGVSRPPCAPPMRSIPKSRSDGSISPSCAAWKASDRRLSIWMARPSESESHMVWHMPANWPKRCLRAVRPTMPSRSWPVRAAASAAAGSPTIWAISTC